MQVWQRQIILVLISIWSRIHDVLARPAWTYEMFNFNTNWINCGCCFGFFSEIRSIFFIDVWPLFFASSRSFQLYNNGLQRASKEMKKNVSLFSAKIAWIPLLWWNQPRKKRHRKHREPAYFAFVYSNESKKKWNACISKAQQTNEEKKKNYYKFNREEYVEKRWLLVKKRRVLKRVETVSE